VQGEIAGKLADLAAKNKPGAVHVSHQFFQSNNAKLLGFRGVWTATATFVMAGLDPAIHAFLR
jgi:hypothetical protein